MLSMNGIIILEIILGGVLMSLIFTSFSNTDLIAGSSSKAKHEAESDSVGATVKPARARTDLSPDIHARFSHSGPSSKENKPRTHSTLGDQLRAYCSCILVHSPIMFTGFPVLLMAGSGHANGL
jgi:hypothetical protein